MRIGPTEQQFLLDLSRKALNYFFENGEEMSLALEEVPQVLGEDSATFVTLTKNGELRGCIGKLEAVQMCYLDVIENTYSAAFSDPRFDPLAEEELNEIKIEISILSKPQELNYEDASDLIVQLEDKRPGVVLEQDFRSATFLPQVWEELTDAKSFLKHLCLKAGLDEKTWVEGNLKISTYTVQSFKED